jgi:hypothetical protein
MNRTRWYRVVLSLSLLICLICSTSAYHAPPVLADGTTVEINSGTPVVIAENETRSDIPIAIRNIPNLGAGNGIAAFSFELIWNRDVFQIDAITGVSLSGWAISAGTPNNVTGRATLRGTGSANYLVSSATVATLTITGLTASAGPGALIIKILDLRDNNSIPVSASALTGQVLVTKPTTTPAPGAPGPTSYSLTIAVSGSGTVSPAPGTYSHPEGAVVNLTATPSAGGQFTGWTGDVSNPTSPTTQVTMNASKKVTANFSTGPATYSLTILVSGQGTVSPPVGSYSQPAGTTIELKATAAPGWRFSNWSGEVANPTSPTTTITINGNKTITASFVELNAPTPTPPGTPSQPAPTPATTPPAAGQQPPSRGLQPWQIALIIVGALALIAVLYFVLKRFITMRMYRV